MAYWHTVHVRNKKSMATSLWCLHKLIYWKSGNLMTASLARDCLILDSLVSSFLLDELSYQDIVNAEPNKRGSNGVMSMVTFIMDEIVEVKIQTHP